MIKKALFFFCSIALNLHFCFALSIIPSNHGKCDTIITVEGKTYIVEIVKEDARQVQFSLCNETTGNKYGIVNDRIREIRRANGKITKPLEDYPVQESTPLIKPKPAPTPSIFDPKPNKGTEKPTLTQDSACEILTFSDGKSLEVRIVEEDNFNYFYMICGNTDDTVYIAPIKQVNLEKKKSPKQRKKNGCLMVGLVIVGLVYLISFAVQLIGA
ncbi:MAG: hypothetical protein WCR52_07465 [Bacteroidota bacterium]